LIIQTPLVIGGRKEACSVDAQPDITLHTKGAFNRGPTWPPAQQPSATGISVMTWGARHTEIQL